MKIFIYVLGYIVISLILVILELIIFKQKYNYEWKGLWFKFVESNSKGEIDDK